MCTHKNVIQWQLVLSFPFLSNRRNKTGELAQLARASALQAEGQGFKSLILQKRETEISFKRSSLK